MINCSHLSYFDYNVFPYDFKSFHCFKKFALSYRIINVHFTINISLKEGAFSNLHGNGAPLALTEKG